MGIEMLSGPQVIEQRKSAGQFTLPLGFEERKWAAQWVPEKAVPSYEQRQYLVGIPATADGWVVYKGEDGKEKPCKAVLSTGTFTLMVRPRDVQVAVNALYGNLGKERARSEQEGSSIAGQPLQDPGMLPINRLRKLGVETEELETSDRQFAPTPIHLGTGGSHVDDTQNT